jgi:hypothetical protein
VSLTRDFEANARIDAYRLGDGTVAPSSTLENPLVNPEASFKKQEKENEETEKRLSEIEAGFRALLFATAGLTGNASPFAIFQALKEKAEVKEGEIKSTLAQQKAQLLINKYQSGTGLSTDENFVYEINKLEDDGYYLGGFGKDLSRIKETILTTKGSPSPEGFPAKNASGVKQYPEESDYESEANGSVDQSLKKIGKVSAKSDTKYEDPKLTKLKSDFAEVAQESPSSPETPSQNMPEAKPTVKTPKLEPVYGPEI